MTYQANAKVQNAKTDGCNAENECEMPRKRADKATNQDLKTKENGILDKIIYSVEERKFCNGITCGQETHIWCKESDFSRNRIKTTVKQCQRCSISFQTSMTQAASILKAVHANNIDKTQQVLFIETFNRNQDQRIKYPSLMHLLNQYAPSHGRVEAIYTNKVRVTDRQKLIICNILVALITCTSSQTTESEQLANALAYITNTILAKNRH